MSRFCQTYSLESGILLANGQMSARADIEQQKLRWIMSREDQDVGCGERISVRGACQWVYNATMTTKELWNSSQTGQFVLPGFDKLIGGMRWRAADGRFPERRILPPQERKDPSWLREHWERILAPPSLPTFREKPANIKLGGKAIYVDLTHELKRDLQFIETMEKARLAGGGWLFILILRTYIQIPEGKTEDFIMRCWELT